MLTQVPLFSPFLYTLEPTSGKGFAKLGDGLYLKKEGKIYDGKGLLLGPNSPFKNIPILGMLL